MINKFGDEVEIPESEIQRATASGYTPKAGRSLEGTLLAPVENVPPSTPTVSTEQRTLPTGLGSLSAFQDVLKQVAYSTFQKNKPSVTDVINKYATAGVPMVNPETIRGAYTQQADLYARPIADIYGSTMKMVEEKQKQDQEFGSMILQSIPPSVLTTLSGEEFQSLKSGQMTPVLQAKIQSASLTSTPPELREVGGNLYSISFDPTTNQYKTTLVQGKPGGGGGVSTGGGYSGIDYGTSVNPSVSTEIVDKNGKKIKLTASQIDTVSGFETALSQLNEAANLMDATSMNTGPIAGRWSEITRLVDKADPNIVKLDAKLSSLKANFMKAMSGAAVSESEVARLSKFLPSINDTEATIKIKMAEFKNNLETQKINYLSALGAMQSINLPTTQIQQTNGGRWQSTQSK